MLGRFVRFLIIVAILVGALAYLGGYWRPTWLPASPTWASTPAVDTGAARERAETAGREIKEQAARAAKQLDEVISDGALTAKIKSKMTLDDTVQAGTINVTTSNRVVTLTGTVRSERERERAVMLAQETAGVLRVEDRLTAVK